MISILKESSQEKIKAVNSFTSFKDIIKHIESIFRIEPTIEREIQVQLTSLVSQIYHAALNNSDGYCYKFNLPIVAINSFYRKLKLIPSQVEEIFRKEWAYPKNAHMYSDSYYHILLLLIYYGIKTDKKIFINNSLLLFLIKIWNGRRQEFFPYCNPNVMKYVTQNMLSNKFLASKYESPLQLLANYFVPNLIQKYAKNIETDEFNLKRLLMQSYSRIYQIFSQQTQIDPKTGKKKATGGLSALYYKAHAEGASSKSKQVKSDDENEASYDQYGSAHIVDEIISSTTNYIVLNKQKSYPDGIIKQLNRLTHVSAKVIHNLALDLHYPEFHDDIQDILTLILSLLNVREKSDICSSQFILDIKKKIISSKNNLDSKKIVKLIEMFLDKLFKKRGLSYDRYSIVQRIQIRTVLVHLLVFNLKKVVCHQQATQQILALRSLRSNDILLSNLR